MRGTDRIYRYDRRGSDELEERSDFEMIDDSDLKGYAFELVSINKNIAHLQDRAKYLKGKMLNNMSVGSKINCGDYEVQCVFHRVRPLFRRLDVLSFLREEYGYKMSRHVDYVCTRNRAKKRRIIRVARR